MGCRGCGADLPLEHRRSGPKRMWCSERCRKRQYDGTCSRCGGRMSGTDPGRKQTTMCAVCFAAERHEEAAARLIAEAHRWFALYGEQPSAFCWDLQNCHWKNRAYAEGRSTGRFNDKTLAELEQRHRHDGPWPATSGAINVFGSWSAFIEAAGFQVIGVGKNRPKAAWRGA